MIVTYACPVSEAGASYALKYVGIDGEHGALAALVESTASWDQHEPHAVGTITLPAGEYLVSMTSGKPEGPLMKLREVRLVALRD